MESRTDAILAGENKYFTGKPCKNGHIAHRYVQSGSCELCIRGAQSVPNPEMAKAREDLKALRLESRKIQKEIILERRRVSLLKRQMRPYYFEVHLEDEDYFSTVVLALARIHFPGLQSARAKYNSKFIGANVWRHYFLVFPEDFEALKHLSKDLTFNRMSEKDQAFIVKNHRIGKDGWVPPPLRVLTTH
jgi:hypothetical protein